MQQSADWRHWLLAAVMVALLVLGGWKFLSRPAASPRAAAPAGNAPRMQDAPEHPPAVAPR